MNDIEEFWVIHVHFDCVHMLHCQVILTFLSVLIVSVDNFALYEPSNWFTVALSFKELIYWSCIILFTDYSFASTTLRIAGIWKAHWSEDKRYLPKLQQGRLQQIFKLLCHTRLEDESLCCTPGGVLPYMGYIGMCDPKGYGFSAVLVINWVSILAILPPFWS